MTYGWRHHLVKRHDFFVEQMRTRMLSRFENIEAEPEEYAEAEYERIGSSPASEYDQCDMASVADNLYSVTTNQAAIAALFRVVNRYVGNLPSMPGVFPDSQ
jgi:hypothetical protein